MVSIARQPSGAKLIGKYEQDVWSVYHVFGVGERSIDPYYINSAT